MVNLPPLIPSSCQSETNTGREHADTWWWMECWSGWILSTGHWSVWFIECRLATWHAYIACM